MTTEEFWDGEPRVVGSYIKKHEKELDEMNYNSWLIGLYVQKALVTTLGNMFGDKNSVKDTYFEKPLECFNSNYNPEDKNDEEKKNTDYRTKHNYWAKFGAKGRKE